MDLVAKGWLTRLTNGEGGCRLTIWLTPMALDRIERLIDDMVRILASYR